MAFKLWRLTQLLLAVECVLILAVVASCQGSAPHGDPAPDLSVGSIPPALMVEDLAPDGTLTAQGPMGVYQFTLNPATMEATLEPVARQGSELGDTFSVDTTGFLAGAFCTDCFRISSVGITPDGYLYADYSMRHPFALPANNPAGAADRLDLHVFDLKGIFLKRDPEDSRYMGNFVGLNGTPQQPGTLSVDNSGFLAGITLDGWTSAFDDYTDGFFPTTANAHPFILMHEDTRPTNFDPGSPNGFSDLRDPMGHNVFPMGGGPYIQRVVFTAEPGQMVSYLIVLTANFTASSTGPGNNLGQRANPTYYLPWANSKSPWRVKVNVDSNTLTEGDPSTQAILSVEVCDWQHSLSALTLVNEFRVENQARNSMLRTSRITGLEGVVDQVAPVDEVKAIATGGAGTVQDPLTFQVIVPNASDASEGSYLGALRIVDDYAPGAKPDGVGTGYVPFAVNDFSTFVTFALDVAPGIEDPVVYGQGAGVYESDLPKGPDEAVLLDARPSGNLALYEFGGTEKDYVVMEASGFPVTDGIDLMVAQSNNGGASFGLARRPYDPSEAPGDQRNPEMVVVQDSLTPGQYGIHLVWDGPGEDGSSDVFHSVSTDTGVSFSTPKVVHLTNVAGGQHNPSLAVNPHASDTVVVAFEESNNGHRVLTYKSDNAGLTFGTPLAFDDMANTAGGRRPRNPHVVMPPVGMGEPNTMAVIWERRIPSTPTIAAATTTSGYAGLAAPPVSVVPTSGVQTATQPSALYVPGASGANLLVAYTLQKRVIVASPLGGELNPIETLVNSRVQVARKQSTNATFDVPVAVSDTDDVTAASMPALACRGNLLTDHVLMVWHDDRARFSAGSDIYSAVSLNGGVSWTPDFLAVGGTGNQRFPSIAVNQFNQFRLVYRDEAEFGRGGIKLIPGLP